MKLRDLVLKNRSYRRFHENVQITGKTLLKYVESARHVASSANLQPLKYLLSCTPEQNAKIFPTLSWAGYLKEWPGPEEGQRPTAYIVILGDTRIAKKFDCDYGIAAQTILLGAAEDGLGGCIIASVRKRNLRLLLNIPTDYRILAVIAVGKPAEIIQIETATDDGDIKYWRDERGVHHVPKRSLEEIVLDIM